MIWHIFRKDLALLSRFALIVASVHLVNALISARLGSFMEPGELRVLGQIFPYLSMLGVLALSAIAVQQEPLTGISEDFLVRPISRVDLMLAKLLFVLLVVQGPLFIADVIESGASGFGLLAGIQAAASHGASTFLLFALPAMSMAAITRNLTELVIGSLLLVVGASTLMLTLASGRILPPALSGSGLEWMRLTSIALGLLVVALFVLPVQYMRRQTSASRALAGLCAIGIALAWSLLPWEPSFAVQRYLGAEPASASSPAVSFAPHLGRARPSEGGLSPRLPWDPPNAVRIHLPLEVEGLPRDALLYLDRTVFRIKARNGATMYEGTVRSSGRGAALRAIGEPSSESLLADGRTSTYQELPIPGWFLTRYKNIEVRVEIDQSLTVLRPQASLTLPALRGHLSTPTLRCVTRPGFGGDDVQLGCLSTRKAPSCAVAYLRDATTGARNPPIEACRPDYSNYSIELVNHVVRRMGASLPFFDPDGRASYPVNTQRLHESEIVVVPYEATSHVSRHIVTPPLRLEEWQRLEADPTTTAAGHFGPELGLDPILNR